VNKTLRYDPSVATWRRMVRRHVTLDGVDLRSAGLKRESHWKI
jgi:cytochrome P450